MGWVKQLVDLLYHPSRGIYPALHDGLSNTALFHHSLEGIGNGGLLMSYLIIVQCKSQEAGPECFEGQRSIFLERSQSKAKNGNYALCIQLRLRVVVAL